MNLTSFERRKECNLFWREVLLHALEALRSEAGQLPMRGLLSGEKGQDCCLSFIATARSLGTCCSSDREGTPATWCSWLSLCHSTTRQLLLLQLSCCSELVQDSSQVKSPHFWWLVTLLLLVLRDSENGKPKCFWTAEMVLRWRLMNEW